VHTSCAPTRRDRIKREFAAGLPGWENFGRAAGWDQVRVASVGKDERLLGKTVRQIADERRVDPVDAFCDVLVEEDGSPTVVMTMMDEADVRRILAHPLVMIGSDAIITRGKPHPRTWGTYPRVLGHYARDIGLFSQAEAVRKMTSLPARKFGLLDRGLIRPGMAADLVAFDPATVRDAASPDDPDGRRSASPTSSSTARSPSAPAATPAPGQGRCFERRSQCSHGVDGLPEPTEHVQRMQR
jgi:N-acyl-D-amino-acid deacylase